VPVTVGSARRGDRPAMITADITLAFLVGGLPDRDRHRRRRGGREEGDGDSCSEVMELRS
jgi:hypothetical protein